MRQFAIESVYHFSFWDGLDEKLLLRSDGTSVYMTQDLGTAKQRIEEQALYVNNKKGLLGYVTKAI